MDNAVRKDSFAEQTWATTHPNLCQGQFNNSYKAQFKYSLRSSTTVAHCKWRKLYLVPTTANCHSVIRTRGNGGVPLKGNTCLAEKLAWIVFISNALKSVRRDWFKKFTQLDEGVAHGDGKILWWIGDANKQSATLFSWKAIEGTAGTVQRHRWRKQPVVSSSQQASTGAWLVHKV